ncbi:D-alanine--D-alanine ligase family protein [Anaerotignum sp.]|nr:D-alanine--D-alanine ligase family protein [Anaerotignum sp.]MBQ7757972.1 D-alanine--D-alanine ligase [Anaerotignum sp.]
MYSKKTVAVIFGGQSSEHEVSRVSAMLMLNSLNKEKYQVLPVGITKKGEWLVYNGPVEHVKTGEWEKYGTPVSLSPDATKKCFLKIVNGSVKEIPVDVVIPVLHGAWGEDGTIQGLLEMAQIPYVGCGVLASAVSMDKVFTKMIAKSARIPQAKYLWVHKYDLEKKREKIMDQVEKKLGYPCFVKPSNAGSSVGISKAKNREQLSAALDFAAGYDRKVIVEEAIVAREFECAVLGNEEPIVSGVGEVLAAAEFYDYDAKYNNSDSRTVIPAEVEQEKVEEMRRIAKKIFRAVDGSGLARVDFFVDKKTGKVLFNELNTMPGFTPISMYPMLWKHAGMTETELMDRFIQLALTRDSGIRG